MESVKGIIEHIAFFSENNAQLIPFYAFYKKLGIDKNGNTVYARTYVPAFEVSGYEEYFKSQEAEHKS
jgi:pyruvate dehydrogenase complex dehydrogenase (E1) component